MIFPGEKCGTETAADSGAGNDFLSQKNAADPGYIDNSLILNRGFNNLFTFFFPDGF
jgi:hypothetical protein